MNNELAPGVIALVVGLVEDTELNGISVELYEFDPGGTEIFYDPIDDCYYRWHEDDMSEHGYWGCIVPSLNEYLWFEPKNLLPLGKKNPEIEKDKEKENELCKST